MMENHKIILSKEFVSDYSKNNTKSYNKVTHQDELGEKDSDNLQDMSASCSKLEEALSECVKNYYNTFLNGDQDKSEKDRTEELLKCAKYFKDYEPCVKRP